MLNYEEFAEAFKEGLSAKLGEMPEKGELQFLKKAKINCEVDGVTFRKSEGDGGSDEDKKLKDQLAVSDKAFKIHFTKTLSAESARAYCEMVGKRFFRTKYKEIKVDIYIF